MKERKKSNSISISRKLLAKIEKDIIGKSRSAKVEKCARVGYEIFMRRKGKWKT